MQNQWKKVLHKNQQQTQPKVQYCQLSVTAQVQHPKQYLHGTTAG